MRLQIILMMLVVVGCKNLQNKKNAGSSSDLLALPTDVLQFKSLVSPNELVAGALPALTPEELTSDINKEVTFFHSAPMESSPCDTVYDAIPVKTGGQFLTYGGEANLTDCINKGLTDHSVVYTEAVVSMLFQAYCDRGGMDVYKDKKLSEINDLGCGGGLKQWLHSYRGTYKMKISSEGQEFLATTYQVYEEATPDHRPCVQSPGINGGKATNCIGTYYNRTTSLTKVDGTPVADANSNDEFSTLNFSSIVFPENAISQPGTFYPSGTINFVYNDWHGTMTYSGATVIPRWTAMRGQDTRSGTFNYTKNSLSLQNSAAGNGNTFRLKFPH